jgi:hypothetical protein
MTEIITAIVQEVPEVITAVITEQPETITASVTEVRGRLEKKHYWDDPYSYCCTAPIGSSVTDAVWTITRIKLIPGGVEVKHAYGVKWTDCLTVNYN